ncbi:hypothetical protein BTZ20_5356 [Rhodococcus sp. MTM3W5.2]|nr:hypothetical protein BTZ20_5356 [Rhodococcus sp. MTM3W5.2]
MWVRGQEASLPRRRRRHPEYDTTAEESFGRSLLACLSGIFRRCAGSESPVAARRPRPRVHQLANLS